MFFWENRLSSPFLPKDPTRKMFAWFTSALTKTTLSLSFHLHLANVMTKVELLGWLVLISYQK